MSPSETMRLELALRSCAREVPRDPPSTMRLELALRSCAREVPRDQPETIFLPRRNSFRHSASYPTAGDL
jgi:hypothetical protein